MVTHIPIDVVAVIAKELWSWYVPHLTLFYIISQPLLQMCFPVSNYHNNKTAWKRVIAIYNFIMCIFSLATFVVSLQAVMEVGLFGNDCQALLSHPVFNAAAYYFYLSKYVEYLDTYFLIVSGKSVSFLQYFHHAGAAVDMFILWRFNNEGVWIFVVFNSLIHTFMYGYYGLSALEVPGVNKFRVMMTSLQLVQLVVGVSVSAYYLTIPCYSVNPYLVSGFWFNFFYISVLVLAFGHFYYHNYLSSASKSKGKSAARGKTASSEALPEPKPAVASAKAHTDDKLANNVLPVNRSALHTSGEGVHHRKLRKD